MKNKLLPIIFLLLIIDFKAKSQIDTNQVGKNLIYIEGAGIGGYGSLNYERVILNKTNLWLCTRVGLSTYNLKDYTNNFNSDIIQYEVISPKLSAFDTEMYKKQTDLANKIVSKFKLPVLK